MNDINYRGNFTFTVDDNMDIIWRGEILMSKGIIVAGFGAIGKTTLGNKYDNVIDMESGYYQWDNTGFENIPYEQRKGKKRKT